MDSRRAGMIAILFIILMLGLWLIATSLSEDTLSPQAGAEDSITLMHSRVGEEQRYKGLTQLPSPCDALATALSVSYGRPPSATISLRTERKEGIVCAAQVVDAEFSVSFMSEEEPEVSVELNGRKLPVNVVEQ